MAYLKHKALFFTTSPRTPFKLIPEILLLLEHFTGSEWNTQTQIEFYERLVKSDFFESSGSSKDKAFSARDRINRAPKTLGFIDLSPNIQLSDAGNAFIYGKRPREIFLRQLLKVQFPSPYHVEVKRIKGTFYIKPYLELLRLIRDLGSLSFDELKIYGLTLTDYRKYDAVKNAILNFRAEKENNKGQYKKFVNEVLTNNLLQIFSDEIASGNTKTREKPDKSLKSFLDTKKRNFKDYADACFRDLRYTGLVSISHRNSSISFYPEKIKEVDFILENVERDPIFINDTDRFKEYLFNPTIPALYDDNIRNVIDQVMRLSKCTRRQLLGIDIEELKDIRDTILTERREAVINAQIDEIKSYALYSEIIDTYHEIITDDYYDAPLMLEYNTWRAMTMLDGGIIRGNFKFDDMGKPLSTAPGNMSDIECDYGDFVLCVEVTTQKGQRQYESEGEPVTRHFGQMKKRTGKETFCLFIAPEINKATLAHFFVSNKTKVSYYEGKTKIIPLELGLFMKLVESSYNYHIQPTPNNIRQFLDEVIRQEELAVDEVDWNDKIHNCVIQWLK